MHLQPYNQVHFVLLLGTDAVQTLFVTSAGYCFPPSPSRSPDTVIHPTNIIHRTSHKYVYGTRDPDYHGVYSVATTVVTCAADHFLFSLYLHGE